MRDVKTAVQLPTKYEGRAQAPSRSAVHVCTAFDSVCEALPEIQ
jgi:hypothetical protein